MGGLGLVALVHLVIAVVLAIQVFLERLVIMVKTDYQVTLVIVDQVYQAIVGQQDKPRLLVIAASLVIVALVHLVIAVVLAIQVFLERLVIMVKTDYQVTLVYQDIQDPVLQVTAAPGPQVTLVYQGIPGLEFQVIVALAHPVTQASLGIQERAEIVIYSLITYQFF